MASVTFDTHFFVKKLISQGMPEKQAEAVVEFVRETKEADLEVVASKYDLHELDISLKADLRELELRLESQIKDLQIRIGAMLIALGGILIAVKYFG